MDSQKASYIVKYFPRLMSIAERTAWWHNFAMNKIEQVPAGLEGKDAEEWQRSKIDFYRQQGLVSGDPSVIQMLEDGFDAFVQRTAERIHSEIPEEVFLNECPNCKSLARTPQSKQCRHCGHSWREEIGATFRHKLTRSHNLKPGYLVFEGEVESGSVEEGMKVDLTYYGINRKPEIEEVKQLTADRISFDFEVPDPELRIVLVEAGSHIEPINIEK